MHARLFKYLCEAVGVVELEVLELRHLWETKTAALARLNVTGSAHTV